MKQSFGNLNKNLQKKAFDNKKIRKRNSSSESSTSPTNPSSSSSSKPRSSRYRQPFRPKLVRFVRRPPNPPPPPPVVVSPSQRLASCIGTPSPENPGIFIRYQPGQKTPPSVTSSTSNNSVVHHVHMLGTSESPGIYVKIPFQQSSSSSASESNHRNVKNSSVSISKKTSFSSRPRTASKILKSYVVSYNPNYISPNISPDIQKKSETGNPTFQHVPGRGNRALSLTRNSSISSSRSSEILRSRTVQRSESVSFRTLQQFHQRASTNQSSNVPESSIYDVPRNLRVSESSKQPQKTETDYDVPRNLLTNKTESSRRSEKLESIYDVPRNLSSFYVQRSPVTVPGLRKNQTFLGKNFALKF